MLCTLALKYVLQLNKLNGVKEKRICFPMRVKRTCLHSDTIIVICAGGPAHLWGWQPSPQLSGRAWLPSRNHQCPHTASASGTEPRHTGSAQCEPASWPGNRRKKSQTHLRGLTGNTPAHHGVPQSVTQDDHQTHQAVKNTEIQVRVLM